MQSHWISKLRIALCLVVVPYVFSSCSRSMRKGQDNICYSTSDDPFAVNQDSNRSEPFFSKKKYKILLDPGHGAQDRGCQSKQEPKIKEKALALYTAKKVENFLKAWGYQVEMTRKKDVFIPLDKRVKLAEHFQSHIFVSMHYNFAPNPKAHGIEIFYYPDTNNKSRSTQSKALASCILKRITGTTSAYSRGVKTGNFAVIRETKIPAVLIEGGFLSNPAEARCLSNPSYVNRLAWSIAKGIEDYIRSMHLSTQGGQQGNRKSK